MDPERIPPGSEAVAKELDELNAQHQRLLDLLYERLRRIAAANPGDIVTLVSFILLFSGKCHVFLLLNQRCNNLACHDQFIFSVLEEMLLIIAIEL